MTYYLIYIIKNKFSIELRLDFTTEYKQNVLKNPVPYSDIVL